MNPPLRSLSGLLDFDCAARWGSFKLAANELHKTPAAVSLQIRQLEQSLGFELFVRHPRHVALTGKGRQLAASVADMLAQLRAQVALLQDGDEEKVLRISTTQSLALKWLVPRIHRFTRLYPELEIRIDSSDRLANMDDGSTDVALRFHSRYRDEPGLLFRERLVAVYSPALLAPGQQALTLADLCRFPLLYEDSTDTWIQLLRENQVLKSSYDFSRSYTNLAVLAQAALAGQGIGLVSYTVAFDDIASGALKMIACRSAPSGRGYRLVIGRGKDGMLKIERFRHWLDAEIALMQQSGAP